MSVKRQLKQKRLSPEEIIAWGMLIGSLVMWPISMFTFAKDEYPVTLSLSWLALAYAAMACLFAAKGNK